MKPKSFLAIGSIIAICLLVSCATIEIDESTGKYKYSRIGNQELIDVRIKMERAIGGTLKMDARLGKQDSDPEIAESLAEIRKMLKIVMDQLPEVIE